MQGFASEAAQPFGTTSGGATANANHGNDPDAARDQPSQHGGGSGHDSKHANSGHADSIQGAAAGSTFAADGANALAASLAAQALPQAAQPAPTGSATAAAPGGAGQGDAVAGLAGGGSPGTNLPANLDPGLTAGIAAGLALRSGIDPSAAGGNAGGVRVGALASIGGAGPAAASPADAGTAAGTPATGLGSFGAALGAAESRAAAGLTGGVTSGVTGGVTSTQSIHSPVGSPGFAGEVSQQVVMLSRAGVQSAHLTLSPAELGQISVSIDVRGQMAHVTMDASQPQTRAALEQSLPKLHEMFASSGLQLAQANVGGGGGGTASGDDRRPRSRFAAAVSGLAAGDGEGTAGTVAVTTGRTPRLVDTFA